jgi:hypothetical protein
MTQRVLLSLLLLAGIAVAEDRHFYSKGTLSEMSSVECGLDENSGKTFVGEIVGTDSAHKKTRQMLCPEYVLKTDRVVYRIRPRDEKHPVLLPVGQDAEFRMKKEVMVLRVPEGDNKERTYTVVSMTQTAAAESGTEKRAAK